MRMGLSVSGVCLCGSLLAGNTQLHAIDKHSAFNDMKRWQNNQTALKQGSGTWGKHMTLTWSIVPDGTATQSSKFSGKRYSSLIATLDKRFGAGPGGNDLTLRPWFDTFSGVYERWDQLSGLRFVYQSNDDGKIHGQSGWKGVAGKRGDMRICGTSIDGSSGSNTLAYNYYPQNGDMNLDIDNKNSWRLFDINKPVSSSKNNSYFINILTHETGHGLGLPHVESSDSKQLMEPYASSAFFGPQMDDILMIQRLYGDNLEDQGGNNTRTTATDIGHLTAGTSWSIGMDAHRSKNDYVAPGQSDFISINDDSDTDYFKFEIDAPSQLDILLNPAGITYKQGKQGGTQTILDMTQLSDLRFDILNERGGTLASFNDAGLGDLEMATDFLFEDAGTYFLRVKGDSNNAQFYSLQMDVAAIPEPAAFAVMLLGSLGMLRRKRCN